MSNPILHSIQISDPVEDLITDALQGATIALTGVLALLTFAAAAIL